LGKNQNLHNKYYAQDLHKKHSALKNLSFMNTPSVHLFAFDVLKKTSSKISRIITNDLVYLINDIKKMVKSYYEINEADCMIRLWDAYDYQKDKSIKKMILILIDDVRKIDGIEKKKAKN